MAKVVFGPFELDTRCLELWKDGRKMRLRPQPCRVLAVILSRPGRLVTRDEIRLAVWPSDVFVRFDLGLNSCLKQIRRALGDTARSPTYLETLNGRGYRFIGNALVTPEDAAASHRRVTILPFTHGGGATQTFAEGLTDDLARLLTREDASPVVVVDASVLGSATSMRAAVQAIRSADVDFLLRGRVQAGAHSTRVTASMVATHDLSHVWADAFCAPEAADFEGQERLAFALAQAVTAACVAAPQPCHSDASALWKPRGSIRPPDSRSSEAAPLRGPSGR
jgi:DNA-binding winged helix-turn-helix (wHTH) protein